MEDGRGEEGVGPVVDVGRSPVGRGRGAEREALVVGTVGAAVVGRGRGGVVAGVGGRVGVVVGSGGVVTAAGAVGVVVPRPSGNGLEEDSGTGLALVGNNSGNEGRVTGTEGVSRPAGRSVDSWLAPGLPSNTEASATTTKSVDSAPSRALPVT